MIKFVLGGAMDPSFKKSLSQAEREAAASADRVASATARLTGQKLRSATLEEDRYQKWLENNANTLKTVTDLRRKDTEEILRNAAALRALNDASQTPEALLAKSNAKERAYRDRKALIMGAAGPGIAGYGFRGFDERANQGFKPLERGAGNGFTPANFNVGGPGGFRGMLRRGAYGGAASAMFVSVARDTAASLASGANPLTVFMQQAPQVLQAMTMIGLKIGQLLPVIASVGAALLAAFAAHYISKGIAGIIYGLDKIAARGERLENTRQMFRRLVKEMQEAKKAAVELAAALASARGDNVNAREAERAAKLDEYKTKLEAEDLEARRQGGSGRGQSVIDDMVRQKALEFAKQDLDDAQHVGPSSKTAELRAQLAENEAIPFLTRTDADRERGIALKEQLGLSEATDTANRSAQITNAENKVRSIENEIAKAKLGEPGKTTDGSADQRAGNKLSFASNDWLRAGGSMGGPAYEALTISKSQLVELKAIRAELKQRRRSPWG